MTDYANGSTPRILLRAYLTTDHISDATGKTIAVTISKNGGAFANPAAGATNATEIANGWYYVDLGAGDTGTNGPIIVRGTAAATDTSECRHDIVPATNGRLSALPAVAAEGAGGLFTRGTGAGQIRQDANGRIDVNAKAWIDGAIPAVNVTGVPLVDDKYLLGTIYSTPATAGIQDVNVKNMNNVSGAAITTVKAVQGLTTADTIATYTGNTKQTADVATLITTVGAAGAGLTNLGDTRIANLDAAVSSRSVYAGGAVASVTAAVNVTGDLSATMKTSVQTAADAAITANALILEIEADTDTLTAGVTVTTNNDKTGYSLTGAYDFAKGTVAMTEVYPVKGATFSPSAGFYHMIQLLSEMGISGTTMTVKKRDQATTAKTFTLDDATNPAAITEAS